MGKDKGDYDREMVKSLDQIPNLVKWGQTTRFIIDKKQKLGLGAPENGRSCRLNSKKSELTSCTNPSDGTLPGDA